jgi:hypothetical protein
VRSDCWQGSEAEIDAIGCGSQRGGGLQVTWPGCRGERHHYKGACEQRAELISLPCGIVGSKSFTWSQITMISSTGGGKWYRSAGKSETIKYSPLELLLKF